MKPRLEPPDLGELNRLLSYDQETGKLHWKVAKSSNTWPGKEAGSLAVIHGVSYRTVRLNGPLYLAHHLVWYIVTGTWPEFLIDHKDRDGTNNRFGNLRPATTQQNCCNSANRVNNTSGFKGVAFDIRTKRWRAIITVNRKPVWLGRFDRPEDAHAAYCQAASNLHGEFARFA